MGESAVKYVASREDFLAYLDSIPGQAEWLDGVIHDLSGGTFVHNMIGGNVVTAFNNRLSGKNCRALISSMMVEVLREGAFVFPDVSVICGNPEYASGRKDILLNPKIVVEVLSPSTAAYDRGGKLMKYFSISSLSEYILIEQAYFQIDVYHRAHGGNWMFQTYQDENSAVLIPSLGISIPLSEIYAGISLD